MVMEEDGSHDNGRRGWQPAADEDNEEQQLWPWVCVCVCVEKWGADTFSP